MTEEEAQLATNLEVIRLDAQHVQLQLEVQKLMYESCTFHSS